MGTSVFFGNRREDGLRLKPGDLERIGIQASGPVLAGKASVSEAQEQALRDAHGQKDATETGRYLRRGRIR